MKKDSGDVISIICISCDTKLSEFTEFRTAILRVQSENFFVKTEAAESIKVECESEISYETDPTEEFLENFKPLKNATIVRKNISRQNYHCCAICPEKHYRSKYSLEKHMILNHKVEKPRKEKFPKTNLCFICAKIITNGRKGMEYHVSTKIAQKNT